jgi:hypothetical protein
MPVCEKEKKKKMVLLDGFGLGYAEKNRAAMSDEGDDTDQRRVPT